MKTRLLTIILLLTSAAIQAQKVLIKDSTVHSDTGGPFKSSGNNIYIYDSSCQLAAKTSGSYRYLYTHNEAGLLSQETWQHYNSDSGRFVNLERNIYTYNAAGKVISALYQNYDASSGTIDRVSQDSSVYDNHNFLIQFFRYENPSTDSVKLLSENYLYNLPDGTLDSNHVINHTTTRSDSIASYKYDYTYYDAARKNYQVVTYSYGALNYLTDSTRDTYYHDSANYITNDSVLNEYGNFHAPGYYRFSILSQTYKYDIDGTVREQDDYDNYYLFGFSDSFKTYNTYGLCSSALPVQLLSFSAQRQSFDALLKWQTASETGASSFDVQRSTDGIHFTTIGSIHAMGNSNHQYTFTDINALQACPAPKLYYRLAERDKDGSVHYSSIASLNIAAGKVLITASPNPATNMIKVYSSVDLQDAFITISDLRGRILYSAKQTITSGSSIPVDVSAFAKGVYIVMVQTSSYKQQVKIVKE